MGNGSSSEIQDEISKMELRSKFADTLKGIDANKTLLLKELVNKSSDFKNNIKKFAIFTHGESQKFHYWVTKELLVIAFSVPFQPFPCRRFAIHKFLGEKFISIFLPPLYYSYMIYFMEKVNNTLQKTEFLDHILNISKNIENDTELDICISDSHVKIPNLLDLQIALPGPISENQREELSQNSEEEAINSSFHIDETSNSKVSPLTKTVDVLSENQYNSSDSGYEFSPVKTNKKNAVRKPLLNRLRRTSQYSSASSVSVSSYSSSAIGSIAEPPSNESEVSQKYIKAKNEPTSSITIRFSSEEEESETESNIVVSSPKSKTKSVSVDKQATKQTSQISPNPRLGQARSSNLLLPDKIESETYGSQNSDYYTSEDSNVMREISDLNATLNSTTASRKRELNSIKLKSRKKNYTVSSDNDIDPQFLSYPSDRSHRKEDTNAQDSSNNESKIINASINSSEHQLNFELEHPSEITKSKNLYHTYDSDNYSSQSGQNFSRNSISSHSRHSHKDKIESSHSHHSSVKSHRSQYSDNNSVKSSHSHHEDNSSVKSNRSQYSDKDSIKSSHSHHEDNSSVKSNTSHSHRSNADRNDISENENYSSNRGDNDIIQRTSSHSRRIGSSLSNRSHSSRSSRRRKNNSTIDQNISDNDRIDSNFDIDNASYRSNNTNIIHKNTLYIDSEREQSYSFHSEQSQEAPDSIQDSIDQFQ